MPGFCDSCLTLGNCVNFVHDEFTISQICEKSKEVNMYYLENYLTLHKKLDKYFMTLGMISWKQLVKL